MKKNITVMTILTVLLLSSVYLYVKVRHLEQRISQIEQHSELRIVPVK